MPSRVFKAFHYREFRLLWFGACTSSIGTWMQVVAQSWLVFSISKSAFMLGLDGFLGQIPIVLFSLIGGVIADRIDRRRVLLGSQYVQMTSAFLLTLLIAFNVVKVWHILSLSFVVGCAQSFGGPAYSALVPMLVEKEDLPNAIALNSIQFNLARVIGPVLGGLALTGLGAAWCFGLNGLS
ncbi:MAG: MFS transporter, partial [Bryobacteraceae bacterium]